MNRSKQVPADAATLTLLGNAYMADSKLALALQQFQAAAVLDPENPKIKTGVAVSEIDTGQTEQGLAQLEELFASETGAAVRWSPDTSPGISPFITGATATASLSESCSQAAGPPRLRSPARTCSRRLRRSSSLLLV